MNFNIKKWGYHIKTIQIINKNSLKIKINSSNKLVILGLNKQGKINLLNLENDYINSDDDFYFIFIISKIITKSFYFWKKMKT